MIAALIQNYMLGAQELLAAIAGSSSLTTTGNGVEVSSEVVLLVCGLCAGWLALPFVSQAHGKKLSCAEKLAVSVAEATVESDEYDQGCAAGEFEIGWKEDSSISLTSEVSRKAGLALMEQYGVFGAAPGSWSQ